MALAEFRKPLNRGDAACCPSDEMLGHVTPLLVGILPMFRIDSRQMIGKSREAVLMRTRSRASLRRSSANNGPGTLTLCLA